MTCLVLCAGGVAAQTHKHSMALYCNGTAGGTIISDLISCVRNYSSSSKAGQAAAAASKAAAGAGAAGRSPAGGPAQHTAMQGQLLQLLASMDAAAAAARSHTPSDARQTSTATAAAGLDTDPAAAEAPDTHEPFRDQQQSGATAAGGTGPAAAAAGGRAGSKRSRAAARLPAGRDSSTCDAKALQQLLQERQKDLLQLKQLSK